MDLFINLITVPNLPPILLRLPILLIEPLHLLPHSLPATLLALLPDHTITILVLVIH